MGKSIEKNTRLIRRIGYSIGIIALGLISIQWSTDTVVPNQLLYKVPITTYLTWLESPWTYLYLHIFTFVPVLALSFDKKVHFYTSWRYLFPAIAIVATIFIIWDVFFTIKGVWGFNPTYLSGLFILHLPIEEWLFFITVPFACIFIYECLNAYFPKNPFEKIEPYFTYILIGVFLVIGFAFWSHMYTATTFILTGLFLLYHNFAFSSRLRADFYRSYLISWVPFMLVNGVLTGGYTQEPIVLYNPVEYLGIRMLSIPLDDSIYSLLMLIGVTTLFEWFRTSPKQLTA